MSTFMHKLLKSKIFRFSIIPLICIIILVVLRINAKNNLNEAASRACALYGGKSFAHIPNNFTVNDISEEFSTSDFSKKTQAIKKIQECVNNASQYSFLLIGKEKELLNCLKNFCDNIDFDAINNKIYKITNFRETMKEYDNACASLFKECKNKYKNVEKIRSIVVDLYNLEDDLKTELAEILDCYLGNVKFLSVAENEDIQNFLNKQTEASEMLMEAEIVQLEYSILYDTKLSNRTKDTITIYEIIEYIKSNSTYFWNINNHNLEQIVLFENTKNLLDWMHFIDESNYTTELSTYREILKIIWECPKCSTTNLDNLNCRYCRYHK